MHIESCSIELKFYILVHKLCAHTFAHLSVPRAHTQISFKWYNQGNYTPPEVCKVQTILWYHCQFLHLGYLRA